MAAKSAASLLSAVAKKTAEEPTPPARGGESGASRQGKVNISVWLSPSYRGSLRAIQMQHPEKNLQALMAEALNNLFERYNVPTVRED